MRKIIKCFGILLGLLMILFSFAAANPMSPDWRQIDNSGPSRKYHKCAYDTNRNKVVLFGGMDWLSVYDTAVWEWSNGWTRIDAPGPGPRIGHGLCYDTLHHVTLLFGGQNQSFDKLDDFWSWDGATWTQIQATGPAARAFFAFAYDPHRQRAVLFSGMSSDMLNDTWEWDGAQWTERSIEGPPPRNSSAMAFDYGHNRLVLFGGLLYVDEGYLDDTWILNDSGWVNISCDVSPPARAAHSMVYDGISDMMMIFGGFYEGIGPPFNDTWIFNGSTWFAYSTRHNPSGRYCADMVTNPYNSDVFLIGGADWYGTLSDIWIYPVFSEGSYVIGDANNNGVFNGLDVTFEINYFKGFGPTPLAMLCYGSVWYVACDVNNSCSFNGLDITYSVNYFKGIGPDPMPCEDCPPGW